MTMTRVSKIRAPTECLKEPQILTPEEVATHERTHIPSQPWCELCVKGGGTGARLVPYCISDGYWGWLSVSLQSDSQVANSRIVSGLPPRWHTWDFSWSLP